MSTPVALPGNISEYIPLILVPSTYCKRAWDEGFARHKLKTPVAVIPHGVEPWMKDLPDRGANAKNATLRELRMDKRFKFLTNYTARSFAHRKGIDASLKAYFETFTVEDPVLYIIKTEDIAEIRKMIDQYNSGAAYLILDEALEITGLVRLYNLANCYVSTHRGEAWAIDVSNAIACGLLTITTQYGGPVDYAGPYTNWVGIEKELVPGVCWANPSGSYAEPKHDDIVKAMKSVVKNVKSERMKAIKASAKFRHEYTWDKAADICIAEITKAYKNKFGDRGVI